MGSPKVYDINPHLSWRAVSDDRVYVVGDATQIVLKGRGYRALLERVNGRRTDDDIVAAAALPIGNAEAYYSLMQLEQEGVIVDASVRGDDAWAGWQGGGVDAARLRRIASRYRVAVSNAAEEVQRLLTRRLESLGFSTGPRHPGSDLKIVVAEDYCDGGVGRFIQSALETGAACYPVKISGRTSWFGPLLTRTSEVCWQCVVHQLERNRPIISYLKGRGLWEGSELPGVPTAPPGGESAAMIAAVRLAKALLSEEDGDSTPAIETFDVMSFDTRVHHIRKRPQCPSCGDPDLFTKRSTAPVVLSDTHRRHLVDTGARACQPTETWARWRHLVSDLTGVVTRVEPMASRYHPLRVVYTASYYVPMGNDERRPDSEFVCHSFGKGRRPEQARVSALCEAVERYAAIYQGDESVIRGRYSSLEKQAIHPRVLENFSERQYENAGRPRDGAPSERIPLRYDDEKDIDWTYAWSLTREERVLLPLGFCYSHVPIPPDENVSVFSSNGNAAGNTLEEAILQGLLELVERDAVAIWWYNRGLCPGIDLESFDDDYLLQVEKHYRDLGWEVWLLDVTHDLGTPVVVALARHRATGTYITGMGGHLSFRVAVRRAITEMHQLMETGREALKLWSEDDFESADFLSADPSRPLRTASDHRGAPTESLRDDVSLCVERLGAAGLETIVLDYTRPDIGLTTVKVVVPGLRHFWRRLGAGRLYEVPVGLGRLDRPLTEDEMNPKSLVL